MKSYRISCEKKAVKFIEPNDSILNKFLRVFKVLNWKTMSASSLELCRYWVTQRLTEALKICQKIPSKSLQNNVDRRWEEQEIFHEWAILKKGKEEEEKNVLELMLLFLDHKIKQTLTIGIFLFFLLFDFSHSFECTNKTFIYWRLMGIFLIHKKKVERGGWKLKIYSWSFA